jgi:hypothetical protein
MSLQWEDKTFYVEWFTDDRRFVVTDSEVATS